jgi:hypothetical protein
VRDRAWRRRQKGLRRKAAKRLVDIFDYDSNYSDELKETLVRLYTDNRKPCSCGICTRKRKELGPTRQEIRTELDGELC